MSDVAGERVDRADEPSQTSNYRVREAFVEKCNDPRNGSAPERIVAADGDAASPKLFLFMCLVRRHGVWVSKPGERHGSPVGNVPRVRARVTAEQPLAVLSPRAPGPDNFFRNPATLACPTSCAVYPGTARGRDILRDEMNGNDRRTMPHQRVGHGHHVERVDFLLLLVQVARSNCAVRVQSFISGSLLTMSESSFLKITFILP